jgi:hypothetical protein
MTDKGFSPEKFIDREAEQELFDELLKFQEARLLTIRDAGGRGKSSLLKMLEYKCIWQHVPPTPVSLVPLDQLPDLTPFALISDIREKLSALSFTEFDRLNAARASRDFSRFRTPSGPVQGSVYVDGASVSGSAIGTGYGMQQGENIQSFIGATSDWSIEQEEIALRACVKAFFEDLKQICDMRPVVVLLDSWERSSATLREWMVNRIVLPLCFDTDNRPQRFALVLAGRELPDFKQWLGDEARYNKLVKSIESLGVWEENHVRVFLQAHGYEGLDDEDIGYLCSSINRGTLSLESTLRLSEMLRSSSQAHGRQDLSKEDS